MYIISLDFATPALRTLLTGGDQLRHYPDQRWPIEVVNHYGPTETSVVATATPVSAKRPSAALPPIGRPIANTQTYILDQQMRPVPFGESGELCIGGAGVARGYLNDPALTAEKFIPDGFTHPEGTRPGVRLYRTGDLARYLADGNLEFLGRIDHQVKIRGFRIELGEIEALLQQHPVICEAVVVAREADGGEKRLIAYVVENKDTQRVPGTENRDSADDGSLSPARGYPVLCSPQELRAFLGDKLPSYMVPSFIVLLDALPLTPNGKIDRRALLALEQPQVLPEEAFVGPRTALEAVLCQFWCEVLGVERVGVFTSFFVLGGHSLLATQIARRVQQVLGVKLPVGDLFEAPTVAGLAQTVRAHESRPGSAEKIAELLLRIKGMSTTDLKQTLEQKRSQ